MIKQRKNHDGISMIKGLAALIVVILHVPFPGLLGDVIAISCEFAVPLFFMVTGYFAYKKQDIKWILGKIKGLLVILVIAELIAGFSDIIIECCVNGVPLSDWFYQSNIAKKPIQVIFFGTAYNGSLWFIYAMIYVYIIYIALIKLKLLNKKWFYIIIPVFYVLLVIGRLLYQNNFTLTDENVYIFRNFLLPGLPMTLMGSYLSFMSEKLNSLNLLKRLYVLIAGVIIMPLEFFLWKKVFANAGMEHYFFTIIIAIGLFIIALKFSNIKSNPIKWVGEKHYTYLYILHVPIMWWVDLLAVKLNIYSSGVYSWTRTFIVIGICVLFSMAILAVKGTISKRVEVKN